MSFFSEASLAMIPSGYKTSKVYSALPITGDGDLTFSRSNDTATRVGPNGLIEKVRTNIALYSEQFDNAYWTKSQATITANATTAPDGTLTAEKFIEGSGSVTPECSRTPIATSNSIFTLSVFAKAGERNFLIINNNTGLASARAWFNLSTGVVGTTTAGTTAFIENVGNGWFRCSLVNQILSFGGSTSAFQIGSADGVQTYTGDGTSGIFIWGAQMELGDIATDYIPTTTAAVTVGPVANVPRLDYLDSSSPRLLLEPQRTNLVTYSEQFDNAAWSKDAGGTGVAPAVTANAAVSPDGYTNADLIVFNSGAGTTTSDLSIVSSSGFSMTNGTSYTTSFYAKGASASQEILIRLSISGQWAGDYQKITITNEWARYTFTQAAGATDVGVVEFGIRRGLSEPINASASINFYGFQTEAGAYATSYIPTLGAAVTRGADASSKTGIGSLIGQTAGTIYWESNQVGGAQLALNTTNNVSSDGVQIYASGNFLNIFIQEGGTTRLITSLGAVTEGTNFKIALAYGTNFVRCYINGVETYTTSATIPMPAMTMLNLSFYGGGATVAKSETKQVLLFKSILTPAQLAELTA